MYFGATADDGYEVLSRLLAWMTGELVEESGPRPSGGCATRWWRTRRPLA